ncbi:hypothetical protein NPIL_409411 [Nephila pilipes]|uniref:Integrase catalytic domain-containing protein n=1 Tax=Nephila pilipes TaxID=299642 RepID=A0A8X6NAW4_NEPPI|nr:hypothetical protein NPIL_409411 [Nephila pilipes]
MLIWSDYFHHLMALPTVDMHRSLHPMANTILLSDISAATVAKSFIAYWVSHFGVPSILTTYQGRQFQTHLFSSLKSMLGIQCPNYSVLLFFEFYGRSN